MGEAMDEMKMEILKPDYEFLKKIYLFISTQSA